MDAESRLAVDLPVESVREDARSAARAPSA